jgi:glycosyltransferase involved in cell wall biosynthesis
LPIDAGEGAAGRATADDQPAPRIGILVVAYNAVSTLASVLDRVPADFRPRITQIFVCDDASEDATYLVGLGYKQAFPDLPLTIIRNPRNLGYGGNQKLGYKLAIDNRLDIVVLLHGDGQYAPECLDRMVEPLARGECDAVLGSRMLVKGAARAGGMPLYKFVGNKVLTRFQNAVLHTSLSEFHSGYRAYRVAALAAIPFERNSDDFDFDTQIIIQLLDARMRICEVPIPTYYGDEISYVNGLHYAKDVSLDVVRYRFSKLGFFSDDLRDAGDAVPRETSHEVIVRWLGELAPASVLTLGRSGGLLAARLEALGHRVTALDVAGSEDVVQADFDQPLPAQVAEAAPFDVIVAADVLEHVAEPRRLLEELRPLLRRRGVLVASVPNFGHWYARARTAVGKFDYDARGVLDHGHLRFFTRASFARLLETCGFSIRRQEATGLPLEALTGRERRRLRRVDEFAVRLRPTLFGYQLVYECEPALAPDVIQAT